MSNLGKINKRINGEKLIKPRIKRKKGGIVEIER
jgi:hypothetical protein